MAAVKAPELCAALQTAGHEVRLAATRPALSFFDPAVLPAPREAVPVPGAIPALPPGRTHPRLYLDEDEWPTTGLFRVGEPVLHIELRKWAQLLVIAPLDANTLAKLALGFCDNLLTCVYRAWDFERPVVLAPAMNTLMWEHPATARHLRQLLEDHRGAPAEPGSEALAVCAAINSTCPRLRIVSPVSKRLACGDEGLGGMAAVPDLVQEVGRLSET